MLHADGMKELIVSPQLRATPVQSFTAVSPQPVWLHPAQHVVRSPRVAKYQQALRGAAVVHVGRMPAFDRNGTARLNRFVFRRVQPASSAASQQATPVGGEPAGRR
jgi:hypothetical protein